MNRFFEDCARGRMEELKELYAQLFLLLDQSLEDPGDENGEFPRSRSLQGPLHGLMQDIAGRTRDFQDFLSGEQNWQDLCTPEFRDEIFAFGERLNAGLRAMHGHLSHHAEAIRARRDRIREELNGVRDKKRGRKGYAPAAPSVSALFNSEV